MNSDILLPIILFLGAFIVTLVVLAGIRKNRSEKLRGKFGSEYDIAVAKTGDTQSAERELNQREKVVDELDIHPLDESKQAHYLSDWQDIQTKFVDDPKGAVDQANILITEVMIARGFPVEDFERRAADLSVLHPEVVPDYRLANEIAQKNSNDGTTTEELRMAMVYYHSLFEKLLVPEETKEIEATR